MRFGMKEVCDVTFVDLSNNKPVLFLDTLKMTTVENKAETSYARGGHGNPKILGWDFNREATLTIQDALLSPTSLSLLAGNDVSIGSKNIDFREVLIVSSPNTVTLSHTPVGITGIYLTQDGYEHGAEQTAGTPATTENQYSIAAKVVTFNATSCPAGSKIIVYYTFASSADTHTVTISADKFPGYYKIIGDTVVRNESTGEDEPFQLVVAKAKMKADFTLTLKPDGDPAVFDFTMDINRPNDSSDLIVLIQYDFEA